MIVIQCLDNQEALISMIKEALAEVMRTSNNALHADETRKQEWITTPVFKVLLKEKGYNATSSITIQKIASKHNIRIEKRGRDLWFNMSDVMSSPSKCFFQ